MRSLGGVVVSSGIYPFAILALATQAAIIGLLLALPTGLAAKLVLGRENLLELSMGLCTSTAVIFIPLLYYPDFVFQTFLAGHI